MSNEVKTTVRTCVSCRASKKKQDLIRFVRLDLGQDVSKLPGTRACDKAPQQHKRSAQVQLDPSGRKPGRGAYMCAQEECYEKARKAKLLERALRYSISPAEYEQLKLEFIDCCTKRQNGVGMVGNG